MEHSRMTPFGKVFRQGFSAVNGGAGVGHSLAAASGGAVPRPSQVANRTFALRPGRGFTSQISRKGPAHHMPHSERCCLGETAIPCGWSLRPGRAQGGSIAPSAASAQREQYVPPAGTKLKNRRRRQAGIGARASVKVRAKEADGGVGCLATKLPLSGGVTNGAVLAVPARVRQGARASHHPSAATRCNSAGRNTISEFRDRSALQGSGQALPALDPRPLTEPRRGGGLPRIPPCWTFPGWLTLAGAFS